MKEYPDNKPAIPAAWFALCEIQSVCTVRGQTMAPSGKAHKKNKAGRKASKKDVSRKKKLGDLGESGMSAKQKNPKAFTFNSARKAQKQVARSADREQKRFHCE